jgi:hypothetical protein
MRGVIIGFFVVLSSFGCSGDDSTDVAARDNASEANDGSTAEGADAPAAPAPVGDVDCPLLTDENRAGGLVLLQLIPQMTSPEQVESIKSLGVSPIDEALEYLEALRPLGGREYVPFGDPADDIERYIAAVTTSGELLDVDGPVSQADVDELLAIVGTTEGFIGAQAGIGFAIDETCGS